MKEPYFRRSLAVDLDVVADELRTILGRHSTTAILTISLNEDTFNASIEAVTFGKYTYKEIESMDIFEYRKESILGPYFTIKKIKG